LIFIIVPHKGSFAEQAGKCEKETGWRGWLLQKYETAILPGGGVLENLFPKFSNGDF
jgi:hypothetical protein